jgi:UDP-glucose 4-epimerase
MSYLVTGGTGLVGSRIVRDLVREGQQVVVYDWQPAVPFLQRVLNDQEIESNVIVVQGDVTDLPLLIHTITQHRVERIIHLAGLLTLESNANPPLALKVNCEGTLCVFEAARILGLKKVVWSSSNSVYGPPERYPQKFIPNDAMHDPQNIYAATKSFGEAAANYYFDQYGVDITGIRYQTVYGVGQRRGVFGAVVRELVLNPALGKPGRVPYDDALIGWSYVDDPVRATVLASKVHRTKTRNFSIMGDPRTLQEVADYVRKIIPGAVITLLPGSFTGDPVQLDTGPVEEEIGYRPEWSMERGIKETINNVRQEHGLPAI